MLTPTRLLLVLVMLAVQAIGQTPSPRAQMRAETPTQSAGQATVRGDRYALVLSEAPVAAGMKSRAELRTAAASSRSAMVTAQHDALKRTLQERKIRVVGEMSLLSNAVFVQATPTEAEQLRSLPGVRGVVKMRRAKVQLERAKESARVNTTWGQLGGVNGAGDNVKIAIIDTGIDNAHPAFSNSPLPMPAGFPRVNAQSDLVFTNNKVIVARSYVPLLADDGVPGGDASSDGQIQLTRPDDFSARDRNGHGTAMAMIAAGHQVTSPQGQIAGVAPGAWLGSYKVFGSPQVNDFAFENVIAEAIEDAFDDGMDIAVLSLGIPADWGPEDDIQCGNQPGIPCDFLSAVAGDAMNRGMVVIAAAGNAGDSGGRSPSFATIESPGIHPDIITVGALINAHEWFRSLDVPGGPNGSVGPGSYQLAISPFFRPAAAFTRSLVDVRNTGNDGTACSALPAGSLNNAIAFVARGSGQCTFATKATNVRNAGAVGVVFYRTDGSNEVFAPGGMSGVPIPAGMIGASDGSALLAFLGTRSGTANATMNPAQRSRNADKDANNDGSADGILTTFSSRGPNIGFPLIKPEVTAVGENIYTATQSFDPNSSLFDASGYTVLGGTSFSAPLVAGVAALVLDPQALPFFDADRVKSAIVNAAEDRENYDRNIDNGNLEPAYNIAMGGGEVQAPWAIDSVVTMSPQTLDFGEVTANRLSQGITRTIRIRNDFTTSLRLTFERDSYAPAIDTSSPVVWTLPGPVDVPSGQTRDVEFRLSGSVPNTLDLYDGVILVRGSGDSANNIPDVKIPYLYLAGDTVPCNIIPLSGDGTGIANEDYSRRPTVKVTDCRGLPIANVPITWNVVGGGATFVSSTGDTDDYGIVEARFRLGPNITDHVIEATYPDAGGIKASFLVRAIADPVVNQGGIVEGAGFTANRAVAPGSLVSIFGVNLGSVTLGAARVPLPIAIGGVNVSTDSRDRQVSQPAPLLFVSPGQINVQIPWEFAGKPNAVVKVNLGDISTQVREVAINNFSPGLFQYTEAGTNLRLIAAEVFRNGQRLGLHGSNRRVQAGDVLELFANGLGPISNGNPPSGVATPGDRLYTTATAPTVLINGTPAPVQFSGLASGFVGLYQVNVAIPSGIPAGERDIIIRIGGVDSAAGRILIQ
ncbi:MAG: S8 family serine peptidase [Bryobacterales bacterium]|nr:S8 family serine peptidase [Bryobacterales bacterium]